MMPPPPSPPSAPCSSSDTSLPSARGPSLKLITSSLQTQVSQRSARSLQQPLDVVPFSASSSCLQPHHVKRRSATLTSNIQSQQSDKQQRENNNFQHQFQHLFHFNNLIQPSETQHRVRLIMKSTASSSSSPAWMNP
ncbi:uncharacterized protein V6R79_023941 [Siganus canaliculatus]